MVIKYFVNQVEMGNHCVCFSFQIKSLEILYCDSLPGSAPKEFLQNIEFFTNAFGPTEELKVIYAHKIEIPPKKVHCCKNDCLMVPYQGPNMNICGLASLISALSLTLTEAKELPKEMNWLRAIHRYNNFCRAVFVDWFVKKKIKTDDLFSPQKVCRIYDKTFAVVESKNYLIGEKKSVKNLASEANLVTFPQLILKISHWSPTKNF